MNYRFVAICDGLPYRVLPGSFVKEEHAWPYLWERYNERLVDDEGNPFPDYDTFHKLVALEGRRVAWGNVDHDDWITLLPIADLEADV